MLEICRAARGRDTDKQRLSSDVVPMMTSTTYGPAYLTMSWCASKYAQSQRTRRGSRSSFHSAGSSSGEESGNNTLNISSISSSGLNRNLATVSGCTDVPSCPSDDWLNINKALPLVPVEVAALTGFAVGIVAARRNHTTVSLSSHDIGGRGVRRHRSQNATSHGRSRLRVGDVVIAINGVPLSGGGQDLDTVAQKLLRLCHRNGALVTIARPTGIFRL